MDPLETMPMPSVYVVVGLTAENSWPRQADGGTVRMAYVATDSVERTSFVSLQDVGCGGRVQRVLSRPTLLDDMPGGVVVEIYLAEDLKEGEGVRVALAQAGATTYYPPQQIDDAP